MISFLVDYIRFHPNMAVQVYQYPMALANMYPDMFEKLGKV